MQGNSRLPPAESVRVIVGVPLVALRTVCLARNDKEAAATAHLTAVVAALAVQCKFLRMIDGCVVPDALRAEAFVRSGLLRSKADTPLYRLHAGIAKSCAPPADLCFHPADVTPGGPQYAARDVREITTASGCGLNNVACAGAFSVFEGLTSLNLSGNLLTTLSGLGLPPTLIFLDVRDNALACPLTELGAVLQSMTDLRAFSFRGNPCSKKLPSARLALIAAIPRMREIACALRVIDTEITVDDRVKGMLLAGCSEKEAEGLRGALALWRRAPRDVPAGSVVSLDLENMTLKHVDLSTYTGLTALKLRGNELGVTSGLAEVGLGALTNLRVLDLRDNRLRLKDKGSRDAVFATLSLLTRLVYLGIGGNEDAASRDADLAALETARRAAAAGVRALPREGATAEGPSASTPKTLRIVEAPVAATVSGYWSKRSKLLALLREQFRRIDFSLRYVDNNEISVSEQVAAAYDEKDPARERFRFDVTMYRALLDGSVKPSDVVALDLSDSALALGSFSHLPNLRTLSLSKNKLSLAGASLVLPYSVTSLDLRYNAVSRMTDLSRVIHALSALVDIAVVGNRCIDSVTGGASARVKLLAGVPTCRRPEWRLRVIDGTPVTIDERMAATEMCTDTYWRLNKRELARTRLLLALQEKSVTGDETELVLSRLKLEDVGALALSPGRFQQLQHLDLSFNRLQTIRGQGIALLCKLESLDLSNNV